WLHDGLSLAAVNGPQACVVAGPPDAVAALQATLLAREVACRPFPTTHAFHTPALKAIASQLTALATTLVLHPPQIPYVSNLTGTWITEAQASDPSYWAEQMCAPVQFADGVATLLT